MALNIKNTNYSGEVLETLLTLASTGNEIVEKGLVCIIPDITKAVSVPRLKSGKSLQKPKDDPQKSDSKGNFDYSEKKLEPKDMMAFTVFNPLTFEYIWRKFQPKGNLVFAELPAEVQNKLLEELSKQVKFELGDHYINGEYGDDDDHLMDGIITQIKKDSDLIVVTTSETTMTGKLKAVRQHIPKALRNNPNLRILMSIDDSDLYDDELTKRESKGKDETEVNDLKYKGIKIETLAAWPDNLIVATLCSSGVDSNLFVAVNLQDDEDVILIDKLSNASSLYFFKLLMKADTNIAFGEEVVILDTRTNPVFLSMNAEGAVNSSTKLADLSVSVGELVPSFDPDTLEYTLDVENTVASTTVTATGDVEGQVITLGSTTLTSGAASTNRNLAIGETVLALHVKAPDGGATGVYKVTVNRAAAAGA